MRLGYKIGIVFWLVVGIGITVGTEPSSPYYQDLSRIPENEPHATSIPSWTVVGTGGDRFLQARVLENHSLRVIGASKEQDQNDFLFVSYNPLQDTFSEEICGGDGDHSLRALYVDALGNTFATGYAHSFDPYTEDLVIMKVAPSGEQLWRLQLDLGGAGGERGLGITGDGNGTLYVCGYHMQQYLFNDWAPRLILITLKDNGTLTSVKHYTIGTGEDIIADGRGNVYITGYGLPNALFLTKINTTGAQQWIKTYGTADTIEWGKSLTFIGESLYCAGYSSQGVFMLHYDLEGTMRGKVEGLDGYLPCGQEEPLLIDHLHMDLAADAKGNIYLPSFSGCYGGKNSLLIHRISPSREVSTFRWEAPFNAYGFGVCLDETALLGYMVGERITAEGHSEGMLVRLPPEVYGKEQPEKDSRTAEEKHPSDIPYNTLTPFVMLFLALLVLSIGGLTARYGRRYKEKREREGKMERSRSLREMVETISLERKGPQRAAQGKKTGTEEFTLRMVEQGTPGRRAPRQTLKGTEEFTYRILNPIPKDRRHIEKAKPTMIPFLAFGIVRTVKEKP